MCGGTLTEMRGGTLTEMWDAFAKILADLRDAASKNKNPLPVRKAPTFAKKAVKKTKAKKK